MRLVELKSEQCEFENQGIQREEDKGCKSGSVVCRDFVRDINIVEVTLRELDRE